MPAMKPIAFLLRLLAIVMVPSAVCQGLSPLDELFRPRSASTSAFEVFQRESRQITIGLALLSLPLVLWIIAGLAAPKNSRFTKDVPPKNPEIPN
jgi:hypothetical protein